MPRPSVLRLLFFLAEHLEQRIEAFLFALRGFLTGCVCSCALCCAQVMGAWSLLLALGLSEKEFAQNVQAVIDQRTEKPKTL